MSVLAKSTLRSGLSVKRRHTRIYRNGNAASLGLLIGFRLVCPIQLEPQEYVNQSLHIFFKVFCLTIT